MIASRLGVPVVPVRLDGLDRILHHTWKFPDAGPGTRRVRRAYVVDRQRLRATRRRRSKRRFGAAWLRLTAEIAAEAPEMWHNL